MTDVQLTMKEASAATGIKETNLRQLVWRGVIKPTVNGRAGGGRRGHRFDIRAMFGLMMCRYLIRIQGGASWEQVSACYANYSSWPQTAVECVLGLRTDDAAEEEFLKQHRQTVSQEVDALQQAQPDHASKNEMMDACLTRLRDAIQLKQRSKSGGQLDQLLRRVVAQRTRQK